MNALDGVLEATQDDQPIESDSLASDPQSFVNYKGVEEDPEAVEILDTYIRRGWLHEFRTLSQLTSYVGGDPVFNKFASIIKQKPDGSVKRRIIMDSNQWSVTAASRKMYKAVLTRATDLVNDILALLALRCPDQDLDACVLDAEDAFWQVPLHPTERRFYCAVLRRSDGSTS